MDKRPELGDLIGRPFVHSGRDVDTGMDCWGLVMEVFRRYGVAVPDFVVDSFAFRVINQLAGKEVGKRTWEEVYSPTDKDVPLVVLMRMHPVYITHAGVYVGNKRIIHTMKNSGVVVSKVATLQSRIAGYYRPC